MYDDDFVSPEQEARDAEAGAAWGDPRRCPRHGTQTSDAFGLFDAPCGACEAESAEADERWDADSENPRRRCCGNEIILGWPRRTMACADEIPF